MIKPRRVITFIGIVSIAVIAALSLPSASTKAEAGKERHGQMYKMDIKEDMKANVLSLEKIHSKHIPMVSKAIEKAIEAIEAGDSKGALTELHNAQKMLATINTGMAKHVKPKFANVRCPIMGSPINSEKVGENLIRKYKGQKVAFCCAGCPPAWDKLSDAEKDTKLAKAKPKSVESHSKHIMP